MAATRRYKILETLGVGGFGTVYRAELTGVGGFAKLVAVKVLNADVAAVDDVARRLRDEARMLGLLRHQSIVGVDSLVKLGNRWAIVMEYVEGVDLRAVRDAGGMPPGAALMVLIEVAAALHVAYDRPTRSGKPLKLLHRDIKPANIQVTPIGEVKVLDFGIARAEFQEREAVTQSLSYGTIQYMAPERMDQEDSHAGDVYALGAVFYEIVTGLKLGRTSLRPERHATFVETSLAKLTEKVPNGRVLSIVRRCLAFEPFDRPSAREVAGLARSALRDIEDDTSLMDWAETEVPPLMELRDLKPDALYGSILDETAEFETGESMAVGDANSVLGPALAAATPGAIPGVAPGAAAFNPALTAAPPQEEWPSQAFGAVEALEPPPRMPTPPPAAPRTQWRPGHGSGTPSPARARDPGGYHPPDEEEEEVDPAVAAIRKQLEEQNAPSPIKRLMSGLVVVTMMVGLVLGIAAVVAVNSEAILDLIVGPPPKEKVTPEGITIVDKVGKDAPNPDEPEQPEIKKKKKAIEKKPVKPVIHAAEELPARLLVSGGVPVELRGGGAVIGPTDPVPPGTYEIFADFGDGYTATGSKVTAKGGHTIPVSCNDRTWTCQ
jgi:serine/threonine-protein kinase